MWDEFGTRAVPFILLIWSCSPLQAEQLRQANLWILIVSEVGVNLPIVTRLKRLEFKIEESFSCRKLCSCFLTHYTFFNEDFFL